MRAALFAAVLIAALAVPGAAGATAINALPSASGINATDTIPACQLAAGCGPSNLLSAMPLSSITGPLGTAITTTATLTAAENNEVLPVSGSGYTITVPTTATLPVGSKVTLAAAAGASVDVCVAGAANFDTNSPATLTAALCSSGTAPGIVLSGGQTLTVIAESGGNWFAAFAGLPGGLEAVKTTNYSVVARDAYQTIPLLDTSTYPTITLPATFPKGAWVKIVPEIASGAFNALVVATSPATIYGSYPITVCCGEEIPLAPGMSARMTFDGTNWLAEVSGTIPGQDSTSATAYTPDVWDCIQTRHFTASSAVTVTIPTGLPAGCNLDFIQDGTGLVGIVGGSGFTLHAYNNDAHSAGQYAVFSVNISAGSAAGTLLGNIAQ